MLKLSVAARVEKGIRKSNDDRALVLDAIVNENIISGEGETPMIAAVCDGCGGYFGGGTAAETVLQTLSSIPPERICDELKLSQALEECRQRVELMKKKEPTLSKMCTTIAGVYFDDDKTFIFHAGDSRVYRFDGRYLARMTNDHSAVQQMIDFGYISESDSDTVANKNVITRCIGVDCLPPEVHVSSVSILPGETYLMCSDGFWGSVSDDDIVRVLSENISDEKKANTLVELALSQGSRDNVSVCLCSRKGERPIKEETSKPFVLD